MLALTESHLTDDISEAEIKIENYTPFRTDRASPRKKGGVITYLHNHVASLSKVLLTISSTSPVYSALVISSHTYLFTWLTVRQVQYFHVRK